jgi:hypothetical protein
MDTILRGLGITVLTMAIPCGALLLWVKLLNRR